MKKMSKPKPDMLPEKPPKKLSPGSKGQSREVSPEDRPDQVEKAKSETTLSLKPREIAEAKVALGPREPIIEGKGKLTLSVEKSPRLLRQLCQRRYRRFLPMERRSSSAAWTRYIRLSFPRSYRSPRELMGEVPSIRKKLGNALGRFSPNGKGSIKLRADIFEDPSQAAKILAHEIGHLIDYLPEGTMKRGNLLGRLFTMRRFLAETFGSEKNLLGERSGPLSSDKRTEIRNNVTRDILKRRGIPFGEYVSGAIGEDLKKDVQAEIREKSKAAIDEYLSKHDYIKNEKVKKELTAVSEYWRPYDKETSTPGYVRYRESSAELYADAISMLFNSPGLLEEMAPTFYKAFFDALDEKPEVREAYFEVQALLSGDRAHLTKLRREGVGQMFKEGDYKAIELQNEKIAEQKERNSDFIMATKFTLIDKNYPMIDRVNKVQKNGTIINPDDNPIYALEERNYLGGKIKVVLEEHFSPVYFNLQKAEIPWDTFGEALFYERIIAGDRSKQANPRGITPEVAKELHDDLWKSLTPKQQKVMTASIEQFRKGIRAISEEAYKEGLYSPELYKQMQENPAYVTFQVLDHLDDGMSARVRKSIGTLKDIANPADSSILKVIATVRAIERNRVSRVAIDFLKKNYPEDIQPAKQVFSGSGMRYIESKRRGEEPLIIVLRSGKPDGLLCRPLHREVYQQRIARTESCDNDRTCARAIPQLETLPPALYRFKPRFPIFQFHPRLQAFLEKYPGHFLRRRSQALRRGGSRLQKSEPTASARTPRSRI